MAASPAYILTGAPGSGKTAVQGFVRPAAARQISLEDSLAFEQVHEQVYRDLGFQLVDVPADRVTLIQQAVS